MSSFKLKISKMCRGAGIAYFLAEVNEMSAENSHIVFHAVSPAGVLIPIESYDYEKQDDRHSQFILAIPMLDTKTVEFYATDEVSGSESNRIKHSWETIKWLSRLNYKLDFEAASQIRDTDRFTYSSQIHINVLHYVNATTKNQAVIKGIVCAPANEEEINIHLIDGNGKEVPNAEFYIGRPSTVIYEGISRLETSFSVRIPTDGKTYCIVADGSEKCRSGFLCLDNAYQTCLRDTFAPRYYRIADNWDHEERLHNRKFLLADSSDYRVPNGPKFSIVVPLYNTPIPLFDDMVSSVISQLYCDWELILVNSTPENMELRNALDSLSDVRIKIVPLEKNYGISGNTNRGIECASGDYIVFFDHDDILDKLVLYRYARAIIADESIDALYCDEDFLTEDGRYINPHFKSDFNIDLLRAHNYITHLLCVRSSIAKSLMLNPEYDGAQDYDFVLRLSEITNNIRHVPEVLYHWRMSDASTAKNASNKTYAQDAGQQALNAHLGRLGLPAKAVPTEFPFIYRTSYEVDGNPFVSIIIPNKDAVEVLSQCINSIYEKTSYRNFEIIIIENNSTNESTFEYYESIEAKYDNLKIVVWEDEFNYSKINNFGAEFANGEFLLLLNNDIEVISPDWLDSMLGYCCRNEVGIVGARLIYPDDTVQHAGVAMGYIDDFAQSGGAMHVFNHLDSGDPGYFYRAVFSQDVSVVTGACLLVKAEIFKELGGLSEKYQVAYNDVDFCLRARKAGYLVVYDANIFLRHYESFSRGQDGYGEKAKRFLREQAMLRYDWPEYYLQGDSYYGKWFNR